MIGPALPPHLQRPKEPEDGEGEINLEEPPTVTKPSISGPQLPPHLLAAREANRKRKREDHEPTPLPKQSTTPPPTQVPPPDSVVSPPSPADTDSDSEIGPSLTSIMSPREYTQTESLERVTSPLPSAPSGPQRDAWMLAPPTRADWLGSFDSSKLKARTFAQSRSGTNLQTRNVDHSVWTETPEQRRQREKEGEREKKPDRGETGQGRETEEERQRRKRIKEYTERTRGPSLMERHGKTKEGEDDPSKRAFDYQKDIASRGKAFGFKQRDEMVQKAKGLDGKYSGGNYL
jgi:Protein of unknown function (DUF3752)